MACTRNLRQEHSLMKESEEPLGCQTVYIARDRRGGQGLEGHIAELLFTPGSMGSAWATVCGLEAGCSVTAAGGKQEGVQGGQSDSYNISGERRWCPDKVGGCRDKRRDLRVRS